MAARVVTCPYCRQSFDPILNAWRKTPKQKAGSPLDQAVTKTLEEQLQQALAALKRSKDTEHVLLAQLAEAERRGFKPETSRGCPTAEDLAGGGGCAPSPGAIAPPPAGQSRGGTPCS